MADADWDFMDSLIRVYDATQKVSPPTSLQLTSAAGFEYDTLLCKVPAALYLPSGRLITWFRADDVDVGRPVLLFRNIWPDGQAEQGWTYVAWIFPAKVEIGTISPAGDLSLGEWEMPIFDDTWHRLRLTWRMSSGILYIDGDRWYGSDWVSLGATIADTAPLFTDSSVLRVGMARYSTAGNKGVKIWFDDTEIWAKVPAP